MLLPAAQRRLNCGLLSVLVVAGAMSPLIGRAEERVPPAQLKFDNTGARVGEQLPNLPLYDLDGKAGRLNDVWTNRTAVLLLTSSLTCPKSRSSYPRAEELAAKLGDELPVEIIYVLEAHPKGDPSPYRGYEDVTAENRRDGILCRQPTSLQERLKLANTFKDRLHVKSPIHVDGMDNAVWSALGGGPNMGVLVDDQGLVLARQGWFDAPSVQKAIESIIATVKEHRFGHARTAQDKALDAQLSAAKIEPWAVRDFEKTDATAAFDLLKRFPALAKYTTDYTQFTHGETVLALAVRGGNLPLIDALIAQGAEVNGQSASSPSPLHVAAKAGNAAVVELLLKRGADVNLKAPAGPTPLQEAAIYGHRTVVDILLKGGAKPDFFSELATGKLDSVSAALEADGTRGHRPDGWSRTPLDYAAAAGQISMIELLATYGVQDDEPAISYVSEPAIHWAAGQKQTAAVAFLLDAGDDPNSTGMFADTLLHVAAGRNDIELAKLVLRHKPNLQIRAMAGEAPLHDAVQLKSYDVAALLLSAGADPNVARGPDHRPCGLFGDDTGSLETPLQLAAEIPDLQMSRLLLAHGAAINARDSSGWTALHHAVSAGSAETDEQRLIVVRFFLAHGADVNAKNSEGQTPLDVTNHEVLRAILIEHGAKPGKPEDS